MIVALAPFSTLTGDMSQQEREAALLAFRDDPPTTVFILSVRAGSVGINLTEVGLTSSFPCVLLWANMTVIDLL